MNKNPFKYHRDHRFLHYKMKNKERINFFYNVTSDFSV